MIRAGHQVIGKIKPFTDLEIPPRKQPFLSHGGGDDGEGGDPYATDHFRMYEFKVRECTRSRNHDWTDCTFLHPGEKARRRDPRQFHYCATICSDFRRGGCPRGDDCEFAHGVFECWLHPTRYRTEACKDGKSCNRKVCFFAHSPEELRVIPEPTPLSGSGRCMFCCSAVASSSPTSTLLGISRFSSSPSLSPHRSPVRQRSKLERTETKRSYSDYEEMLVKKMISYLEGTRLENDDAVCSGACRSRDVALSRDCFGGVREEEVKHEDGSGHEDPDIEWVKELLD